MTDLFDNLPEEATPASPGGGRQDKHRTRAHGRRRTALSFLVMILALALLVGGGFLLFQKLTSGKDAAVQVDDYPGPGTGAVTVTINEGDSGAAIAKALVDAGVAKTQQAVLVALKENPQSGSIQPGTYSLAQGLPAADAVDRLLDPGSKADYQVQVNPGTTAAKVYERVAAVLEVSPEDVQTAAKAVAATLPAGAGGVDGGEVLEGWLAPGTYPKTDGMTAQAMIQKMVDGTVKHLDEKGVPADKREETLTRAALVEREVNKTEYMPKVAQVIQNRIDRCSGDGTLGFDSTLVYDLGIPGNQLTKEQLNDASNPWNSRRVPGLPPGPIATPSVAAIDAVLSPAGGAVCYFVTVNLDTGETKFADDKAGFDTLQAEYREWIKVNRPSETPSANDG